MITRRWLSYRAAVYLLISVGLAYAFVFEGEAFQYIRQHEEGWGAIITGWFIGFCPIVLSPIFLYLSLAELINSTVIRASADELCVIHGPLPLIKSRRINAHDIGSISSNERIFWSPNLIFYYRLVAVLRARRTILLLPGVGSCEQIDWLKNLIRSYLKLNQQK